MTLLTIAQAAAELSISQSRMKQLVAAGRVKHERIGRAIVIRLNDLDSVRKRKVGRPMVYEIIVKTTDRDEADKAQDLLMRAGIKFTGWVKPEKETVRVAGRPRKETK